MSLHITNDTGRGRLHVRSNITQGEKSEVSIKVAKEADVRIHLNRRGELIEVEVRGVRFSATAAEAEGGTVTLTPSVGVPAAGKSPDEVGGRAEARGPEELSEADPVGEGGGEAEEQHDDVGDVGDVGGPGETSG